MKSFLLIFPLFVFLFPQATVPDLNGDEPEPKPVNKKQLLQLVNQVRQKGCQCGDTFYPATTPLQWNAQLEQAALMHSSDMYANNYFSHAAKDGSKAGKRIDRTGYSWKTYGENIAFGYRNEAEVVKGWIRSPGHCKNIMSKSFKEMGVARAGEYWTQVFATK
ncbi:CAP domain-containing protein [Flavisolibacter sp. BT320]|nr:CAP domain-containing protein [Flavisolibacter longurius]